MMLENLARFNNHLNWLKNTAERDVEVDLDSPTTPEFMFIAATRPFLYRVLATDINNLLQSYSDDLNRDVNEAIANPGVENLEKVIQLAAGMDELLTSSNPFTKDQEIVIVDQAIEAVITEYRQNIEIRKAITDYLGEGMTEEEVVALIRESYERFIEGADIDYIVRIILNDITSELLSTNIWAILENALQLNGRLKTAPNIPDKLTQK